MKGFFLSIAAAIVFALVLGGSILLAPAELQNILIKSFFGTFGSWFMTVLLISAFILLVLRRFKASLFAFTLLLLTVLLGWFLFPYTGDGYYYGL